MTTVLTRLDCYRLLHEMQVPDHIVAHSIQVSRVALALVDLLAGAKVVLDRDLVLAAALLHDITKLSSMATGEMHSVTAERLLAGRGHLEVGRVVAQHVRLDAYFAASTPDEAEVLNYADKRVVHDRIASLEERLEDIMSRYGKTPERAARIARLIEDTRRVEARIFSFLDRRPDEIESSIEDEGLDAQMASYRASAGEGSGPLP